MKTLKKINQSYCGYREIIVSRLEISTTSIYDRRKKNLWRIPFFIIALTISFLSLANAKSAGTTMADFLKIGIEAKTAGMGGVYISKGDDIYAISNNIAGTANIQNKEVSFSHLGYVTLINFENLQYGQNIGNGVIGLDIRVMNTTDERREAFTGNKSGIFSDKSNAVMISYANSFNKNFNYGFGLKYIYMSLDSEVGQGCGLDMGILYKTNDKFRVGASIQNIGPKLKLASDENNNPAILKIGADYLLIKKLNIATQIEMPIEGENSYGLGIECNIIKSFDIRAGYKYREEGNYLGGLDGFSAGLGMKISKYTIDYAFVPFGDFDVTHRVSLKIKF
jgi:hypothetical protein